MDTKTAKKIEKRNNKKIVLLTIIVLFILLLIGSTYAILQKTILGNKKATIEVGTLSLSLDENATAGIDLQTATPTPDSEGLKMEPYKFTLKNNGTIKSEYTIYLDDAEIDSTDVRMSDSFVKYNLNKSNIQTTGLISDFGTNPNRIIDSGIIDAASEKTYELRLWIHNNATINDITTKTTNGKTIGKVFATKLRIEASQIKE